MSFLKKTLIYKPDFEFDAEKFLDIVQEQLEWTGMADIERRKTGSVTFTTKFKKGLQPSPALTMWQLVNNISCGRIFVDYSEGLITCTISKNLRSPAVFVCFCALIYNTCSIFMDNETLGTRLVLLGTLIFPATIIGYFWDSMRIKSNFTYLLKNAAAKAASPTH